MLARLTPTDWQHAQMCPVSSVLENAKEFLIGDPLTAFVTGTVLGFALAYGLVTFCPQARKFLKIDENRGYENV